jgi:hypothetical protein
VVPHFAALCDEVFGTPDVFSCIYEDMLTEPYRPAEVITRV